MRDDCGTCGVPGEWQCVNCPRYQVTVWPAGSRSVLTELMAILENIGADRPDPLAEPEGYGQKPQTAEDYDLSVCAGEMHKCPRPPEYVVWFGCVNEHVGPVSDCEQHARQLASPLVNIICGRCGYPVRILRVEPPLPPDKSMDELVKSMFDGKPEL